MIFIYIISSAWWYFLCSVIYAEVHHHHHHHFSLHPSHCWAQASSQNERSRAVVNADWTFHTNRLISFRGLWRFPRKVFLYRKSRGKYNIWKYIMWSI